MDDLDVTVSNNTENTEDQEDNPALTVEDDEMPLSLSKAYVIYQQAFEHINNVEFIIKLLTITEEYNNTEKLQKRILRYKDNDIKHQVFFLYKQNDVQCFKVKHLDL